MERTVEREHVPAALELGMGICAWSPLASGFLAGKYRRGAGAGFEGEGRLATVKGSGNPVFDKFTERNWRTLDAVKEVAAALGRTPAEVAVRWVARRPGVASTIVGATRVEQLDANLKALDLELPPELERRLEEASRPEPASPYLFFGGAIRGAIDGGAQVRGEQPWWRPRE